MNSDSNKILLYRNPIHEYKGFTLYTSMCSKNVYMIDMQGRLVHQWFLAHIPSYDIQLLPNGNLLYMGKVENGPVKEAEGAAGKLVEVDWDGNVVWEYEDLYMHHSFYRYKNGNILYLRWVRIPAMHAPKVKGGLPSEGTSEEMWADSLRIINRYGRVLYEWNTFDHLDFNVHVLCPFHNRTEWTHANSCYVTFDGNILINLMLTNTIVLLDQKTGNILWTYDAGEIRHSHSVSEIDKGRVLLFDNGFHNPGHGAQYSRVIEIEPASKRIVWEYRDETLEYFFSSFLGSCQRLENGNTLICESSNGRIFEVTQDKEVVWEYVNSFYANHRVHGRNNIVATARRYSVEYPAFKNKKWFI